MADAHNAEIAAEGRVKAQLATARGQNAVAMAEAQNAEVAAEGEAKAQIARARGAAEAEQIKAMGAKKAAEILESSKVAVTLAQIEKTGDVLRDAKSTYFFGAEPSQMGKLLANPSVMM